MSRQIWIGLLSLALVSCASTGNYQTTVESWYGAPAQDLFSSWGYPDITERAPDGHHLYIYKTTDNASQPAPDFPGRSFTMTEAGDKLDPEYIAEQKAKAGVICQTTFEADRSNHIIKVNFEGPSCAAKSQFVRLMGNPKAIEDDEE
ncbi:MAG TPA: hypothetical protein VD770_01770 [Coxiellaceae bacterium]|nr:hypothetical protein [Coxiellaceae bacterium]